MNKTAKELISVVVTSYNHAEYLDVRMQSLLNQTYPNLEIIVVDDCSSDNSVEVLGKFKEYPLMQIVALKENGGYANASNLGVSMSKGEFIMFAECDDFNEPKQIETLYNAMAEHDNIGVAYSRSNMVDAKGEVFGDDFGEYREEAFKNMCSQDTLITSQQIQRFFLHSCVIPNMSAALMRKKLFQLVGGLSSDYKACADWDFWCRLSAKCDFFYVAECLNNFRNHATSVRSTAGVYLSLSEMIDLLNKAYRTTKLSLKERYRFKLNLWYVVGLYLQTGSGNRLNLFPKILLQTFRYDKFSFVFLFLGLFTKAYYKLKQIVSP